MIKFIEEEEKTEETPEEEKVEATPDTPEAE